MWLIAGIAIARRNHIAILVPDDRYFRSAFGQASLVMLLLVSGFQLVGSTQCLQRGGGVLTRFRSLIMTWWDYRSSLASSLAISHGSRHYSMDNNRIPTFPRLTRLSLSLRHRWGQCYFSVRGQPQEMSKDHYMHGI